jgi:hypothetical protein
MVAPLLIVATVFSTAAGKSDLLILFSWAELFPAIKSPAMIGKLIIRVVVMDSSSMALRHCQFRPSSRYNGIEQVILGSRQSNPAPTCAALKNTV